VYFITENFYVECYLLKPFILINHKYDISKMFMLGWTPWRNDGKRVFVFVNKLH